MKKNSKDFPNVCIGVDFLVPQSLKKTIKWLAEAVSVLQIMEAQIQQHPMDRHSDSKNFPPPYAMSQKNWFMLLGLHLSSYKMHFRICRALEKLRLLLATPWAVHFSCALRTSAYVIHNLIEMVIMNQC